MNMNRLVLGFFGLGIAVTFYVEALSYPDRAAQMPLIYSVAVALLCAAMITQELICLRRRNLENTRANENAVPSAQDETQDNGASRIPAVFIIFAMAAAYVVIINVAGYLLSTVAFMLGSLWLIHTVSLRFALIGVAVVVTVICLVFIGFLGLPIPLLPAFV